MILPLAVEHPLLLKGLLWATIGLACLVLLLIILSAGIQARADRINARRIACFRRWEEALPMYLYMGQGPQEAFGALAPRDRGFFLAFMRRYRGTLGGTDAGRMRELYRDFGLDRDLPERLRHRNPVIRAQAAMEVRTYECLSHVGTVAGLLEDPKPFVAFAAARTLGGLARNEHAPRIFAWVLAQENYQQDRLLELLEDFGPELLRWLEGTLGPAEENLKAWRLYALLAASMRDWDSLPALLRILPIPDVELQAAVLRALGAIGHIKAWEVICPFCQAEAPALRLHAARAAGALGHNLAAGALMELLADPVYEVRREAATSLEHLGNLGWEALTWVAGDEEADRFARDMATERLDWGKA